jgi:hypothetical protein
LDGSTKDPASDAPSWDHDAAVAGPDVVVVVGIVDEVVVVVGVCRSSRYTAPAMAAAATAPTPSVRLRNERRS